MPNSEDFPPNPGNRPPRTTSNGVISNGANIHPSSINGQSKPLLF